jgi:PhnB protein
VTDVGAAVRWYVKALGARAGWGDMRRARGLTVQGNDFSIGIPEETRTGTSADAAPRTVKVFVEDPAKLIQRAVAAGADGSDHQISDHKAPWGTHRHGGFVDPFGLLWIVSDKSPLTWHGPGRTHHVGYIMAVVEELAALGIKTSHLVDKSTDILPGEPGIAHDAYKRSATFFLPDWARWPWYESGDAYAHVEWDEEYGWIGTKGFDSNHGMGELRYGLDLDLVAEPAEVALSLRLLLDTRSPHSSGTGCLRNAATFDPLLEEALAAHPLL